MNQKMIQMLFNRIQNDPDLSNSPMGQQFLQIMRSGDQNAGVEMANNILNSMGISRDQGIRQAYQGIMNMRF